MREWKQKTQKNLHKNTSSPYINQSPSTILDNSSTNLSSTISETPSSNISTNNILKRKIENKFKLGPDKDKKQHLYLSVIGEPEKIQDDIQILNKASLSHIKSYLKKHNLYKLGSDAPPDLLREIYRSAHLAGKPVINKSSENLIHNFFIQHNLIKSCTRQYSQVPLGRGRLIIKGILFCSNSIKAIV